MDEYDSLDVKTEELRMEEQARLKDIYEEMHNLWFMEKVKARQISRNRDIKDGGAEILPIFDIVANQRRRKILVHSVDCPVGVTDNSKML
jgi:hypothetical protein